jgi:hypothetical protein
MYCHSHDASVTVLTPSSSPFKAITKTSTPYPLARPRVDFRSVESLAVSSFSSGNHGKFPCPHKAVHLREVAIDVTSRFSSPSPRGRPNQSSLCFLDDTGYSSMHSSALSFHNGVNKENEPDSTRATNKQCRVRGRFRS